MLIRKSHCGNDSRFLKCFTVALSDYTLCEELIRDPGNLISGLKNFNLTYSDCLQNLGMMKYHSQK